MNYIARIAGLIREQVPPDRLPKGNLDGLFLMYAVLGLAKRESVMPEDVHNAWVAWMVLEEREHESMRPFHDLPAEVREEDNTFVNAIRRVVSDEVSGRL